MAIVLLLFMGAMCVSEEEKMEQNNRKREEQERARARRQELENGVYAQKVRKYTQFYGRPVSDDMKKFIEENYSSDYSSEVHPPGYPRYGTLTLTYKSSLIDRFETAHKNRNYTRSLEFTKLEGSSIHYVFTTASSTFDCVATFDSQDRFCRVLFRERAKVQTQLYTPPPQPAPQPSYNQSSSNNYYGPAKDWNAHYNAEVARSNQQFRENMNKQAQEWNNYAAQKANRGW